MARRAGDSLGQHMALKIEDAGGKITGLPHDGAGRPCANSVCACSSTTARRRFHMIWRRMAKTPLGVLRSGWRPSHSDLHPGRAARKHPDLDPDPLPLWEQVDKRTAVSRHDYAAPGRCSLGR